MITVFNYTALNFSTACIQFENHTCKHLQDYKNGINCEKYMKESSNLEELNVK